jgi:hypothetical protein
LSEDPKGDIDSPNLFAFVVFGPNNATDPMGMDSYVHATTPEIATTILGGGGFDPSKGASAYTWFEPAGQNTTGGPSMAGKNAVLKVDYGGSTEGTVSYKTHHKWFKAAEAELSKKGLSGRELQRAADAQRWKKVGEYMKSEGKASYRIELSKGKGHYLALNKTGLKGVNITGLSGSGAGEVIAKLTLAGKADKATAAAEALGLEAGVAARFGKAASVIKWVGRPLVAVAIAADAYEIHQAKYRPKTITSVAAGWTGAYLGMKGGALIGCEIGAGVALALGQAGPQVAAPEEIATVPTGGAIGGLVGGIGGGIGGYFGGRKVTEVVYDWVFTAGANPNEG